MILAYEGLNGNLVAALRNEGYEIVWVKETNAGIADDEVIALAKENSRILITEDKDFG
jgi:predicted nuclease of predicted toxin-antitoxin system